MSEYVALVIGYKNAELVRHVLDSLAEQNVLPRLVIVVDNGGTFSETELSSWSLKDRSILISRPDNPGYGAAVNLARKYVDDSALLVLTHDAEFEPRLSKLLLESLQQEGVGAVAPILHLTKNRERVFSAGGKLSNSGLASHLSQPRAQSPYAVDWVDGAIVMFSSQALESIDWLDERYFLYFEDVDTSWRLRRAGWRVLIVPAAIAYQQPGAHPPYLGMRNMALFSRKAGITRVKHLTAVVPRLLRETVGQIRRGLKPQFWQAVRGLRDGYAGKSGRQLN